MEYRISNISVWERYNDSDLLLFKTFAPHLTIVERANFPLWAILGFPGSIFSIIVWSSRPMRRGGSAAAAVYQASLGVVDLCFFIIHLHWYLHVAWQLGVLDYPVVCETFPVINYLIQYLSPTLAFTFTLERYLAICHPFRSQRSIMRSTVKSAIKCIAIMFAFCLITASVQAFVYAYNNGVCTTRPSVEDPHSIGFSLYTNWTFITESLYFFCLPITCLVLNILVIGVLRQSIKSKRNALIVTTVNGNSNTNSDRNLTSQPLSKGARSSTLTLLCTSFYLIIAHLSVAIAVLIHKRLPTGNEYLTDEQIRNDPGWTTYFRFFTVRVLIECFAMTHYAAKFPIYLATSKQFRYEFCRIFQCCFKHQSYLSRDNDPDIDVSVHLPNGKRPTIMYSKKYSLNNLGKSNLSHRKLRNPALSITSTNDTLLSTKIRRRPSPGLSRTVLGVNGQRVRVKSNVSLSV
ncbi:putative G- coupled receptor [Schistosoma japonicum]|uniref:Putative G-coupled receptor n=1 Tax=Schistosoma japonicum TaxID=6182 RepID=A0A4Z2CPS7_SCHJA|nr:putative G- coupled receptor [Schistosoma japonicum]